MMEHLPTELLAEIAEYCITSYSNEALLRLSLVNRRTRDVCVPIVFRDINLHNGLEACEKQVEALVSSGLIRHTRNIKLGIASFLAREKINKIAHEAHRRFQDSSWSMPPRAPWLSPNGWESVVDLAASMSYPSPDKYPSQIDPVAAEEVMRTLFEHTATRLKRLEVKNVSSLGTPYVRCRDGDPSNKKEGTCDARDHIVFSMAACEGDLFSALESASRDFSFPRMQELGLHVFKFMNTMPLICNPATTLPSPLVLCPQIFSFDSVHPHPESVDMLDVLVDSYNHNHVMYLLGALSLFANRKKVGRRKCLRLGFRNYPSEGYMDLIPFPLMTSLTELSLENILLSEGSLDRTLVASPSLTSLSLRGIRMQCQSISVVPSTPSTASSFDDLPSPRRVGRHAWASLFSLCATSLQGLVNLELHRNDYYGLGFGYGEDSLNDDFAFMRGLLRSNSRADYYSLRKLLGAVRLRRAKAGKSDKELFDGEKELEKIPMQRHSR